MVIIKIPFHQIQLHISNSSFDILKVHCELFCVFVSGVVLGDLCYMYLFVLQLRYVNLLGFFILALGTESTLSGTVIGGMTLFVIITVLAGYLYKSRLVLKIVSIICLLTVWTYIYPDIRLHY